MQSVCVHRRENNIIEVLHLNGPVQPDISAGEDGDGDGDGNDYMCSIEGIDLLS